MAKSHFVGGGLSRGLSREILVHIFLLRGERLGGLGGLGRSRGLGGFGRFGSFGRFETRGFFEGDGVTGVVYIPIVGRWWMVGGGWWVVAGGWWLVDGGW
jgi:hypothetical protein